MVIILGVPQESPRNSDAKNLRRAKAGQNPGAGDFLRIASLFKPGAGKFAERHMRYNRKTL